MRALCQRRAMRVQLTCALGFPRLYARVKYQRREDKQRDERDRLLATLTKMSRVLAAFMRLREAFLRIRMSSCTSSYQKAGIRREKTIIMLAMVDKSSVTWLDFSLHSFYILIKSVF